jgi:hypothetical protein
MLAEGEFNRFYIRALCVRAIEDGLPEVIVYRAKEVQSARPESARMIWAINSCRRAASRPSYTPGY